MLKNGGRRAGAAQILLHAAAWQDLRLPHLLMLHHEHTGLSPTGTHRTLRHGHTGLLTQQHAPFGEHALAQRAIRIRHHSSWKP